MSGDETIHASCVTWEERGLLLLGASGAGKSALALELIALGAAMVADDRVVLRRDGGRLIASPPPRLAGLIEARGLGVLRMPHRADAALAMALDLDAVESARMPPRRVIEMLGVVLPLLHRPESLRAAAVLAVLRHGPPLDPDASLLPNR